MMAETVKTTLTLDAKQAEKALRALRISVSALEKGFDKADDQATKSNKKMKKGLDSSRRSALKLGAALTGLVAGAVVFKGLQLLTRGFIAASREALEFSKAIAEVNSILPKNEKLTEKSKQAFIDFSSAFSGDAQTQAKAFYAIVSAGIKTTASQLEVLKAANLAATAGLVDIDTSAKALVSTMNAYSKAGLTAKQSSDALFVAVREGQTTFGELSNNIGVVAPIAAAANVRFDELAGTLAAITKGGISTDIAVTGLKAILTTVIKPAKETADAAKRMGLDFNIAAIESKGFAGFLKSVAEATGGSTEKLGKLFPNVRALGPILKVVSGDFEDFERILGETAKTLDVNSNATADAFKVISQSAAFQLERLQQELANLPQAFFVNFEQPIAFGLKAIREFVGGNGLLLVADAVDFAIGTFVSFSSAINTTLNFMSFLADSSDGVTISVKELAGSYNEALAALLRFTGGREDVIASADAAIDANNREIEALKKGRDARDAEVAQRIANQEKLETKTLEFQAKLQEGRQREVEQNQTTTQTILDRDIEFYAQRTQIAVAGTTAKNEQLTAIEMERQEIERLQREDAKLAAQERKDIEQAEKEVEASTELQRISDNLGRQETIRMQAEQIRLKREKKFTEARHKRQAAQEKSEKQSIFRIQQFRELTNKQRLANLQTTLGNISTLTQSSNKTLFAIGKAAAITQAVVKGALAVQTALSAAPPPFSFALAAATGIAAAINVQKIASAKPPASQGFQDGGIVGGPISNADNRQISVAGGEAILNRRQQTNLFNSLNRGEVSSGSNITVNVESLTGDIPETTIDDMISAINDRIDFGNAELRT